MGLSPEEMYQSIVQNLPQKTGKSIEEWAEIAKSLEVDTDKELHSRLKSEFQLGHFQAQCIVKYLKTNK